MCRIHEALVAVRAMFVVAVLMQQLMSCQVTGRRKPFTIDGATECLWLRSAGIPEVVPHLGCTWWSMWIRQVHKLK